MTFTLNRRRFLSALGLTGVAAAAPGLGVRRALADDSAPRRLIILSTSHGTVHDGWRMNPWGSSRGARWDAPLSGLSEDDFSRALQPLHPHRDRLLIADGLTMASAERDIPGYRHEKGWIHAWTGAPVFFTGQDLFSTQASLDQIVAGHIGRTDRLPSLELSVEGGRPICHAGQAQQLPLEEDPRKAFERLFGLSTATDPLVRSQGSILDYALAEHDAVKGGLSGHDRERLSTHFELVRQLEQRVIGLSTATCAATPSLESVSDVSGYNERYMAMVELIAAAFSCDTTRVATLSMGDIPSEDFGWGWYLSGSAHFDFAHRVYSDPQAAEAMVDYTRYHAAQLAFLIETLAAIPDTDGRSVMDNTLIAWGSEMADGWHGYHHHCALTVGGDWHLRPGRYLHFPDTTSSPFAIATPDGHTAGAGMPHQHFLTSIARAMGVETDAVGIRELTARSGERVDLTGELPGMT